MILAQIWGMVRYELRMQWRRRGLLVFIAVLCVAVFLLGIAIRYWDSEDDSVPVSELVPDPVLAGRIERMQATVAALIGVVAPVFMFLIMGLAIVVADVVPRDRDLAVRGLLDSLPWGYGVYLVGKLLSVWGGVL
jgi:cytochrome b561